MMLRSKKLETRTSLIRSMAGNPVRCVFEEGGTRVVQVLTVEFHCEQIARRSLIKALRREVAQGSVRLVVSCS